MVESAQTLGNDPPVAIANLADNSIAVGATKIDFIFFWNGETSSIGAIDSGRGVSKKALTEAMRVRLDPKRLR